MAGRWSSSHAGNLSEYSLSEEIKLWQSKIRLLFSCEEMHVRSVVFVRIAVRSAPYNLMNTLKSIHTAVVCAAHVCRLVRLRLGTCRKRSLQ